MTTLRELLAQIESLKSQVSEVREREMAEAIAKVRSIVDEYQLSVNDVFPGEKAKAKTTGDKKGRAKVAPKYKDPATGKTWTGRGLPPKWMAGKNKIDFLIKG